MKTFIKIEFLVSLFKGLLMKEAGIAFFLFYSLPAYSQQYTYTQYTKKDGLAGSTVYGMAQDKKGFIWFATETGASRFDGVHFRNFTTADGLPGNEVLGIIPDSEGRIWITTFSKELCYYKNGKIFNSQNDSLLKKIHTNGLVRAIAESNNGDIIILTAAEYIVLHRNQISCYLNKKNFSYQKNFFKIYTGLGILNPEDSTFSGISAPVQKWLRNNINEDFQATMYLRHTGSNDICILSFNDTITNIFGSRQITVRKYASDLSYCSIIDSSTFAIKRTNSFLVYDPADKNREAKFILPCAVNEIFRDREGEYWFSTKGQGVYKLASASFENYKCMDKEINFSVINIQKSGKDIFVAGDNGLYWKYNNSSHNLETVSNIPAEKIFSGNAMINPYQYVFRLPGFTDKVLKAIPVKSSFRVNDSLIISSPGGVYLLHLPQMRITDTIFQGRSTCSFKSGQDYYIGTLNGLYKIDQNKKKTYLGAVDKSMTSRISFIAASEGIIWIATLSEGVIGIRNNKIVARIPALSSRICLCLYTDNSFLWAGTDKGIYKIELTTGRYEVVANYNTFDGLPSDIINCIFINEGIVYAGTSSGLAVFKENVKISSFSNLYLTAVTASGKDADTEAGGLLLNHDSSDIRFEFSGLSFRSGDEIKYKYRLRGLDTLWRWTKDAYLAYSSLPSGNYILELIAVNRFGELSKPVRYQFRVLQSVWEKWWVRLMIAIATMLSIILLVNIRIRSIKKKSEEKISMHRRMLELEQMALRAQMNPHFIFNCLNSIQNFTIKQDVKGANAYLSRFASLIRQTLENSSKLYIPLFEEIKYLRNYIELELLQMSGGFEYGFKILLQKDDERLPVPNMVVQPYIENAIKHGLGNCKYPVPKLSVTFSRKSGVLICIVEDNGPGINSNAQKHSADSHVSMGMSITAKRIEMLNLINKSAKSFVSAVVQNIHDSNPALSGTRVTFKFPLQKSAE